MHRKMSKKFYIICTIIVITFILQLSGCSKEKEGYGEELVEFKAEEEVPEGEDIEKAEDTGKEEAQEPAREAEGQESDESDRICVHVCGKVMNPGVYMLSPGSRIYEAVEMAGGLCEDAAGERLNQASQMEDGQQIYVPSEEEAAQGQGSAWGTEGGSVQTSSSGGMEAGDGKVNLNSASEEQLMTLSGIGKAKATAIIRYREEHGGFQNIEELKEVEGIKDGVFNKVKDQIEI